MLIKIKTIILLALVSAFAIFIAPNISSIASSEYELITVSLSSGMTGLVKIFTLEEAAELSTDVVVAKFVEERPFGEYLRELEFTVYDRIFGEAPDRIFVYVSNTMYGGSTQFSIGNEYVLLLEKLSNVYANTHEDGFIPITNIYLNLDRLTRSTIHGESLSSSVLNFNNLFLTRDRVISHLRDITVNNIPARMYIRSNELGEIIEGSPYVAIVEIYSPFRLARQATPSDWRSTDIYMVRVEEVLEGNIEPGDLLRVIFFADTVQPGERHLVAIEPDDENHPFFYTFTSRDSLIPMYRLDEVLEILSGAPVGELITSWQELKTAVNSVRPGTPATITLTSNFSAPTGAYGLPIYIPEGADITLTSTAGRAFTITQTDWNGRHFVVSGALTLQNIVLCGGLYEYAGYYMCCIPVRGGIDLFGGHLVMKDGSVIRHSHANSGGGVLAGQFSTIDMQGGKIYGNRAGSGGGVDVNDATFMMTSSIETAIISGNEASWAGGGINFGFSDYMHAKQTLTAGIISNNIASSSGGGIYISPEINLTILEDIIVSGNIIPEDEFAPFALNEERIQPHYAMIEPSNIDIMPGYYWLNSGGGIYVGGRLNIYGSEISNNTADYGGGIWVSSRRNFSGVYHGAELNINSGRITNNHATYSGGGIFTINAENYQDPMPARHYANINIMPATYFYGNTAGRGAFAPPSNALEIMSTTASVSAYTHPLNNYDINFVCAVTDSGIVFEVWDQWDILDALEDIATDRYMQRVTLMLMQDITLNWLDAINIRSNIVLTSSPGNTFTLTATRDRHFNVRHSLILRDVVLCGGVGGTHIRGGIVVMGGRLTMEEGSVIRNNVSSFGAGVALMGGTFTMNSGLIENSRAIDQGVGAGVYVGENSVFNMHGGTIRGNSAYYGGGVVVLRCEYEDEEQSVFNFYRGYIVDNHANHNGGGIFIEMFGSYQDPMPTELFSGLFISPAAHFYGNTAGNGAFTPPSNAAVIMPAAASVSVGTHQLNNYDVNFMYERNLFNVRNHTQLQYAIQHLASAGITEQTTITMLQDFAATGETITIPAGVNVVLTSTPGNVSTYTRPIEGRHFIVSGGF